ncbi:MAG: energy-coupling factor transporter transmembrane protein EcfT [Butyrivibrio sp.]|uniref:energy-coupling factor transporter transmembrane component T n=1 Tax=Butyrivibrio sp. TaxID=28121 RepID=UPI0025FE2814|nr:energy-coupling factor transporter transmembrane component T [Butyrivibrio sp.]MCR5770950.1 energy-coupling factor transporter transmembrane protein EcfT [Butyrivibrio sp.]
MGRFESGNEEAVINFDPRTKLMLLLIINTVIISDSKSVIVSGLKISFVILVFFFLIDMKKIKMSVIYTVIYLLSAIGDHILMAGYINGISAGGLVLRIVVYLVERMLPNMMMAWFVLHTTKVSEFIAAMQKMHFPQTITIPFATIFRFFPTLKDEYSSIQDAMKMRNIRFGTGLVSGIEYRMVPLIVSVTKIGDELSAAAMTRGLTTDRRRTSYCKIGFYMQDYVAFMLAAASFMIFITGLIRG